MQGELFAQSVAAMDRKLLPDSVVVRTAEGALLSRSAAVLYVMARLGGMWRIISGAGAVVPESLRDNVYDRIAGVRHRLFHAPAEACPIVPRELQTRFDA
jgi:predicted DCC family thiol-disulfide oxidoreductase YuxK